MSLLQKVTKKSSRPKPASLVGKLEINAIFSALLVWIAFYGLTASFSVIFHLDGIFCFIDIFYIFLSTQKLDCRYENFQGVGVYDDVHLRSIDCAFLAHNDSWCILHSGDNVLCFVSWILRFAQDDNLLCRRYIHLLIVFCGQVIVLQIVAWFYRQLLH